MRTALLLCLSLGAACEEDSGTASGGGASGGGGAHGAGGASSAGGASAGGAGGGALAPGDPAPGWEQAYLDGSVGISCSLSLDELTAAGAPSLSFGDATIVVGFEQVGGNNQDPLVARFDAGNQTYCRYHEAGGPDGRALGLTWDGGPTAYVVYTVVGGGSGLEAAASGGWLSSYGNGGGPKVSFVGRLDTVSGVLSAGTFIIAKKQDGGTNTHRPTGAPTKLAAGGIEFLGESAFVPMNPDRSTMECTDYPFSTRYRLTEDLSTLSCSSSTSCTSATPCL